MLKILRRLIAEKIYPASGRRRDWGRLDQLGIESCISVGAAFQPRPARPSRLESRSHMVLSVK